MQVIYEFSHKSFAPLNLGVNLFAKIGPQPIHTQQFIPVEGGQVIWPRYRS
jgi:hypothetical protein